MGDNNDIRVAFKPTKKAIQEIKHWLIEEQKESDEGFYCNWHIIESAFNEKHLMTISFKSCTVGFIVWYKYNWTAKFNIVEIHPKYRRQGLGRSLVETAFEHFKHQNIVVIDLECVPASSESIWRKLGFVSISKHKHHELLRQESRKKLFKVLIPTIRPTKNPSTSEVLQLWNGEPYESKNDIPTWQWNLRFKKGTRELIKPIILSAYRDWRLCWSSEKIIQIDDKVKYFNSKFDIDCRDYIMIKEIPNPNI